MKKALIVASVASMIDQFNMGNINLLQKMGYKVHVACNFLDGSTTPNTRNIQLKKELENQSVCCHQVDFSRKGIDFLKHLSAYKQIKIILDVNEYDLIHLHSPIGGALGRLAARKTREKGTKVIYTAHGFHFYDGASWTNWLFYYPIEKWLSRYTDTLVTINHEDYSRAYKFEKTNVVHIPGVGIDIEKIENTKIDRNKKRKELGIPIESFLITSVGELNRNKNHEIIIRALGQLKNKDVHYIICGQGYLRSKLEDLSVELGIEDQIHLLGFRQDVLEINLASDLFAFPSHREGLSVALMEAMASGVPVIASDIRGNKDLINENGGYLLPATEVDRFTESIRSMISESFDKIQNMSIHNKETIIVYSSKNVKKKMKKIYTDV